jgi:hypothetical protein
MSINTFPIIPVTDGNDITFAIVAAANPAYDIFTDDFFNLIAG